MQKFTGKIIPYASGLEEELSQLSRKPVSISTPKEFKKHDFTLHEYGIVLGVTRIGMLKVKLHNAPEVERIARMTFEGIIPYYSNKFTGERILLIATETTQKENLTTKLIMGTIPQQNNVWNAPLYRHDGFALKFADFEADAENRSHIRIQLERKNV